MICAGFCLRKRIYVLHMYSAILLQCQTNIHLSASSALRYRRSVRALNWRLKVDFQGHRVKSSFSSQKLSHSLMGVEGIPAPSRRSAWPSMRRSSRPRIRRTTRSGSARSFSSSVVVRSSSGTSERARWWVRRRSAIVLLSADETARERGVLPGGDGEGVVGWGRKWASTMAEKRSPTPEK